MEPTYCRRRTLRSRPRRSSSSARCCASTSPTTPARRRAPRPRPRPAPNLTARPPRRGTPRPDPPPTGRLSALPPPARPRRSSAQPVEKIEDDCDRDFFMTPEEAKDYGIIDEVLASKIRVPTPARPVRRQAPTLPTPRHPTVRPYHTHPRCLSPAPGTVRKLRSRSKLGRGASTPPDATRATIAARASMNNDAPRVCLYLKRRAVWLPVLYLTLSRDAWAVLPPLCALGLAKPLRRKHAPTRHATRTRNARPQKRGGIRFRNAETPRRA